MSSTSRRVQTAVIPIAGRGTRMFPATQAAPKAFFPFFDPVDQCLKPILQHLLEEAYHACSDTPLPTSEDSPADRSIRIGLIISPSQRLNVESFMSPPHSAYQRTEILRARCFKLSFLVSLVTIIEQVQPQGFGHAILCAKDFVGDSPFVVLIGDHLFVSGDQSIRSQSQSCGRQLVRVWENGEMHHVAGLEVCLEESVRSTAVVMGELRRENPLSRGFGRVFIETMMSKPAIPIAREKMLLRDEEELEHLRGIRRRIQNEFGQEDLQVDVGPLYMAFFGIDVLSPSVFRALEQCVEENIVTHASGTKGQAPATEINLRTGQILAHTRWGEDLIGVFVNGLRCDVGLPETFLSSLNFYADHVQKED